MPEQLIASNTYDALGQLISKKVGGVDVTDALGLQKVDYTYNIRGWLKGINETMESQDVFSFRLNYNDPTSATPLFNGNISETYWKTSSDNILRKYGYDYDNLNRLTTATYMKPDLIAPVTHSYDEKLSYDRNGNITRLTRTGEYDDNIYNREIDKLIYAYNPTNKNVLQAVYDDSNDTNGFKNDTDGTNINSDGIDFTYDANGNMTADTNKGITEIKYNHLNLPVEIIFSGTTTKKINYLYDAVGQKILKKVTSGSNITNVYYLDGFQYKQVGTGVVKLEFFPHAEGYVSNTVVNGNNVYNYVFNYTDHLGNVRLSYTKDGDNGIKIVEENNYYPFGLKHVNYNMDKTYYEAILSGEIVLGKTLTVPYKYKYNGKELQDELGLNMYDYGARNYDPAVGRWMNIDNMAEKFHNSSPYTYVNNNPIINVDLDGNEWFYHSVKGGDPTWNWHDGSSYKTGVKDSNGEEVVLTGVEAVVQFNGSRDEKLGTKNGKGGYIDGEGAVTASVTVYGPDGKDDVHTYKGFTMGSDPKKFGYIDEGMYNGNFDAAGKSGSLKSNWAVNARGAIRMSDGSINPFVPSQLDGQYEGYKTGIFIHTSNKNGFAGTVNGGTSGISVGCLLISPSDWQNFNSVMSGVKNFKVQVIRTQNMSVPLQGRNGTIPSTTIQRRTTKFD